jgi:hypothetical protein
MDIYQIFTIMDNPLFDGFAMRGTERLYTWPKDWIARMDSWEAIHLSSDWKPLILEGDIKQYHDYPCIIDSFPAFSARAVNLIGDFLVNNGELLPIVHSSGTYYFYNCTTVRNTLDLKNTHFNKIGDSFLPDINSLSFDESTLDNLVIFRERRLPSILFCTDRFKDRFESAGLQGMVFAKTWKLPDGVRYPDVRYAAQKAAAKWKPKEGPELDIKGNALVIRLYSERKKPTKAELNQAEVIVQLLEKQLEFSEERPMDTYYGNVEGHDPVDFEIRIFLSAPNVDRLVDRLITTLKQLPWNGKYQVAKRRAEYFDTKAKEEYVRFTD